MKSEILSIDWFEVSFLMNMDKILSDIQQHDVFTSLCSTWNIVVGKNGATGTKHYRYLLDIFYNGQLWGTALAQSRKQGIEENSFILKVKNEILYTKSFASSVLEFQEHFHAEYSHITRIDLAVDTHNVLSKFQTVVRAQNELIGASKFSANFNRKGEVEGGYIGSRSSGKFIRIYDKLDELKSSPTKAQYIKRYWKANNFDCSQDVQRFEITLKAKETRKFVQLSLADWMKQENIVSVLKQSLERFAEYRERTELKNKTRIQRHHFIDITKMSTTELVKLDKVRTSNFVWQVQQAIKFDMCEYFAECEEPTETVWSQQHYLAHQRAEKYGIEEWFSKQVRKWRENFEYHEQIKRRVRNVSRKREKEQMFELKYWREN